MGFETMTFAKETAYDDQTVKKHGGQAFWSIGASYWKVDGHQRL